MNTQLCFVIRSLSFGAENNKEERMNMKKICVRFLLIIVLGLVAAAAGFTLLMQYNSYQIEFFPEGEQEIEISVGEKFEEPGIRAEARGKYLFKEPKPAEIRTYGSVDSAKIGDYKLTYLASYKSGHGEYHRTIHVVDRQKPSIMLHYKEGSFTFPKDVYVEEGFEASDNYDGNLTDQVIRTEKDGWVTYIVSDSSGNTTKILRKIHYDDPIAPTLELKGDKMLFLKKGQKFVEPGFQASDNCDGDLTSAVAVSGSVDTAQPGIYTLSYSVEDAYHNRAEAVRKVVIQDTQVPELPNSAVGGVVYLTFDDGPSIYTPKLLDVLAKYNVKATFFVVNTPYISYVKRIAEEGHTVALHTATHVFSQVYASDEAYFQDLDTISQIVEQQTGQKSMLLRFPGGSSNTISRAYSKGIMTRLCQEVQARGYHYFDWNVDSMDAGGASSSEAVFRNVVNGISRNKSSVVLQHDLKGFSVNAVERIIQWGLSNGYQFLPLNESAPGCHHGINN